MFRVVRCDRFLFLKKNEPFYNDLTSMTHIYYDCKVLDMAIDWQNIGKQVKEAEDTNALQEEASKSCSSSQIPPCSCHATQLSSMAQETRRENGIDDARTTYKTNESLLGSEKESAQVVWHVDGEDLSTQSEAHVYKKYKSQSLRFYPPNF